MVKPLEVYGEVPCAAQIVAETVGCSIDGAKDIIRALIKAGFVVAPFEPTNAMLEAYICALGQPCRTRPSIMQNIAKARKRWRAMASMGVKIAFSKQALVGQLEGHRNSTPAYAGSSPVERATDCTFIEGAISDAFATGWRPDGFGG